MNGKSRHSPKSFDEERNAYTSEPYQPYQLENKIEHLPRKPMERAMLLATALMRQPVKRLIILQALRIALKPVE